MGVVEVGHQMSQDLANAFRLQRAGELSRAALIYESILSREPEQVDALRLLAALGEEGRHDQAVELLGRVLALRPGEAAHHAQFAAACSAAGQFERAVVHGRNALTIRPDDPDAHNTVGLALKALGQLDAAIAHFKAVVALRPNDIAAPRVVWARACSKLAKRTRRWRIAESSSSSSPVLPRGTTGSGKPSVHSVDSTKRSPHIYKRSSSNRLWPRPMRTWASLCGNLAVH